MREEGRERGRGGEGRKVRKEKVWVEKEWIVSEGETRGVSYIPRLFPLFSV